MAGRFVLVEEDAPPARADAQPPSPGVRGGRFVLVEDEPAPTAPVRNPRDAARQTNVVKPPEPQNLWEGVSRFFTGEGQRQPDAPELITQSVPAQRNQRYEGFGSQVINALPQPVIDELATTQRAAATGLGFFLNPSEKARAEIIRRQIPTSEFRRDEYGNLQARYGADRPWAYINKPGASLEDLQTFASEIGKYLVVRRATGGAAPAPALTQVAPRVSPLITSTLAEGGRGAVQSIVQQGLSMPLGAEEISPGDVAVSTLGSAAGNVIGHGLGVVSRETPGIVRDVARAVSDRVPGAPARLAERQAAAAAAQESAETLARQHAAQTVRAVAEQTDAVTGLPRLQGQALADAIKEAEDNAAAAVSAQFSAAPASAGAEARQLDSLARGFGVRLAKAQTEGDAAGMQFLYEAAGGMHGAGAQRQAAAFLSAQNEALPSAIRAIAGDGSITSPQAAMSSARTGVERANASMKEQENVAWGNFDDALRFGRTYQTGVRQVHSQMQSVLADNKMFLSMPEVSAQYPAVARVMSMTARMAEAAKDAVPLKDVDRVIQLKRFIDDAWEGSDSRAERRVLAMLGQRTREWLKGTADGELGRRAPVTAARLKEALAISQRSAQTFQESRIMQDILDTRAPKTDQELTTALFGGGEGGLNVSSDGVRALTAMKEALGPSSPEWEQLRQAALQRLTRGLDDAIATNQTPAILTTFKRIEEAFRRNREAMTTLFTPDELARIREAQQVVAAMAPTARNPANPTNSGITAARAARGLLELTSRGLKNVPGANAVVSGLDDTIASARVNMETQGAAGTGFNIVRRLADLWNVRQDGVGAPVGGAYATVAAQDETYPPR